MTGDDDNPGVSTSPPPVVKVKSSPPTPPTPVATAAEMLLEEFMVYIQHPDRKIMCLRIMEAMLPTVVANTSTLPPPPPPPAPPAPFVPPVMFPTEYYEFWKADYQMNWDKANEFYAYEEEEGDL